MTAKKKTKKSAGRSRNGLPSPSSIVKEMAFESATGTPYRILRTTEVDEYEQKKARPAKK